MFLMWQKISFLVVLLVPILATLIFHPNKKMKKISKVTIIISLVCIIFISPIIILINLRYWLLLVILLPIIFRGLGIAISKLDIPNISSKLNKDSIIQLLIVALGAFVLIILTIDYDMWSGLWLTLGIIIFSGTIIMPEIDKSRLLYGILFGALSFIITPILRDENGLVTYFISWMICALPFYYIPLVKRFIKYEVIPYVLIPIISIILMKNGGVPFIWNKFYSAAFLIIIIHIILGCVYYIFEKLNKDKFNDLIKQYYFPVILFIIEFILIYYKNKFKNFEQIITIPLMVLSIETLIISLGRFSCPIIYKLQNKHNITKVNDIYDIFVLIFGEKIGEFLHEIIIGDYYDKLKAIKIGIGTIVLFVTPVCGVLFVSENITFNIIISGLISNRTVFNKLAILFMTISGMAILDSIIKLSYHNKFSSGLEQKDASSLSSIISVNYIFLLIYYLYIFLPNIEKINIYVILIMILWLLVVSLAICGSLSTDLVKSRYNNLKQTRHYASTFLYGNTVLITTYSVFTDSLQLLETDQVINIYSKYCYFIVICTFLCKLIGFDTAIASKKMRSKHIKDSIKLVLLLIFSGIPLIFFGAIIFRVFNSITVARFIINLMYLSFMLELTKAIIISFMPSENNIEESLIEYMTFKRIKSESNKDKSKNEKTNKKLWF